MKQKKCKVCGAPFQPRSTLDKVCSDFNCKVTYGIAAAEKSKQKREAEQKKAERKQDTEKREKLKSRSELMREAQTAFNQYIRARDQKAGYACISSGKPLDWNGNATDAGHYRSVGSAPHLRFNEDNCHAQSKHDNRYLSGNAVDYRIGLIKRIGLARVEALEADNTPKKYTNDDLRNIKSLYVNKRKEIN